MAGALKLNWTYIVDLMEGWSSRRCLRTNKYSYHIYIFTYILVLTTVGWNEWCKIFFDIYHKFTPNVVKTQTANNRSKNKIPFLPLAISLPLQECSPNVQTRCHTSMEQVIFSQFGAHDLFICTSYFYIPTCIFVTMWPCVIM